MPKKYLKKIPYSVPEPEYSRRKAEEQILPNVIKTERGCWEYQGFRTPRRGYGQIGMKDSTNEHTHRVVYRGLRGQIPEGWDVCHTCDNPPCVNPLHLFAAPRVANIVDCMNKGRHKQLLKTHCPKGHPYSGDNLYITPRGFRNCKECTRERGRRRWREDPKFRERVRQYRTARRTVTRLSVNSGQSESAESTK